MSQTEQVVCIEVAMGAVIASPPPSCAVRVVHANAGGVSMSNMVCSTEFRPKSGLTVERRAGWRLSGEGDPYRAIRTAEAANLAKSEFLSTLCHEIRNPVNVMVGMMDLALQTDLTAEQREYLTLMKISSGQLLGVINHTLDIEKIEAGFVDLESVAFSLRQCLGETVKMLTFEAQRKGLRLFCEVAADVPDGMRGDPLRLRQVVLNLLSNALKFTEQGEVVMQVTRQSMSDGEVTCCFAIRDTGPGIPLDKQATIFAPFVQADRSVARRYGGSGLGLSIALRLVKLMKGSMWLESQPGSGSTFFFTICLGLQSGQSRVPQAIPALGSAYPLAGIEPVKKITVGSGGSLRILLVDDDSLNRRLAQLVLERAGCHVTMAISAEAALEILLREQFDAVLMDLKMPGMDGGQATRAIRQREQLTGEHALVFALTANDTSLDRDYCVQSGMDGCLKKPVQPADLFALVRPLPALAVDQQRFRILDERALMDSVNGEDQLLAEIVDLFLTHSDQLMQRARDSLSAANQSQFAHVMHTMKGMFQCLFADAAERVAATLEDCGATDWQAGMFGQLEQEVALLKTTLVRLKRKGTGAQGTGEMHMQFTGRTSH